VDKAPLSAADALARAHAALLMDLHKLEEAARMPSTEGMAELRRRLEVTQKHLIEHFRFEEQDGYMDLLRKHEPRLERVIQQLADEHHHLAQTLTTLVERARVATTPKEALGAQVRAWVERVRRHEARENDLVQNTFNLEISAED
jgi:iron-sulfur cluster repair protein YtfE (RIC family)